MRVKLRFQIAEFDFFYRSRQLKRFIVALEIVVYKIQHRPNKKDDAVNQREADDVTPFEGYLLVVEPEWPGDKEPGYVQRNGHRKNT